MADAGSSSTPVADEFKYDDDNIAANADEISEAAFDNEVDEEAEQQQERTYPRPTSTQGDPMQEQGQDPWMQENRVPQRQSKQFTGAVTHAGPQPDFTRRVIHDEPPEWDGQDPGKNLEPYLKQMTGWLMTTATLPKQRGFQEINRYP
jgi:hypothetical protein